MTILQSNKNIPDNTDKNNLLFKLEQDIAKLLLDKLEHFEISLERASQIAKFILAHLPENLTDEQVMQILPSLDDEFIELAGVVHKDLLEYEEKYKDEATKAISELIMHKHFDEANKLAKDYFQRKIQA